MSDSLLSAQLELLLATGTPFSGSYVYGAMVLPFKGVVDAYPLNTFGTVNLGDLRVRFRAADVSTGVFSWTGIQKIYKSPTSTSYNVVSVVSEFGGLGACVQLRLTSTSSNLAPSSSTGNGLAGSLAFDATYLYVCVADNSWKRVALSAF